MSIDELQLDQWLRVQAWHGRSFKNDVTYGESCLEDVIFITTEYGVRFGFA